MQDEPEVEYEFGWDSEKARTNLSKHAVSFDEATTVFDDPLAAFIEDIAHSEDEVRGIMVGTSSAGRLLFVSFTERSGTIRIISARTATAQERRNHEEQGYR